MSGSLKNRMAPVVAPGLMIALGSGWLLTVQNVIPGVDWAWVLSIGVLGALVLAVGGVDKVNLVVGPSLMIGAFFSTLRQTDRVRIDTEIPSMIIVVAVLMLISNFLPIPPPQWLLPAMEQAEPALHSLAATEQRAEPTERL